MRSHLPRALNFAKLETGETHKHTFFIWPVGLHITGKKWMMLDEETSYYAHLTDRRLIFEPQLHGKAMRGLAYGLWAFKLLAGAKGGSPLTAAGRMKQGDEEMESHDKFISLPFKGIKKIEHLYQSALAKEYDIKLDESSGSSHHGSEVCITTRKPSPLTYKSVRLGNMEHPKVKNIMIFRANDAHSIFTRLRTTGCSMPDDQDFVTMTTSLLKSSK